MSQMIHAGKINDAPLDKVPGLADCNPGLRAVEFNVIVAPAVIAEKKGSIYLPDESKDVMALAQQVGRIVSASPLAFDYERWPDPAMKPKEGDVVFFGRYAGIQFEGADGKSYRILKDKDVGAVITLATSGEPANAYLDAARPPVFAIGA